MIEEFIERRRVRAMGNMRFVVGGTPRGGTTFLSNVLKKLGLRAGHETIFTFRHINWKLARSARCECDVSGGVPFHLPVIQQYKVPVVHLVRHPIPAINSMIRYFGSSQSWGYSVSRWYDSHNALLHAQPDSRIYLEAPLAGLEHLSRRLDLNWSRSSILDAIDTADRGTSTPGDVYKWEHLPNYAKDLTFALGYDERIP
jgi:hypothetical protein